MIGTKYLFVLICLSGGQCFTCDRHTDEVNEDEKAVRWRGHTSDDSCGGQYASRFCALYENACDVRL